MILAVDCGSTNLKGALFTPDLARAAEASVPVAYSRRDAVHAEFEADPLWAGFAALLETVTAQAGVARVAIRTVSLGSQAQSFTLLDEAGRPVMPFLSWMDGRAKDESAELTAAFGADFHQHCTFAKPDPALQVAMLLWVRRHWPAAWAVARRLVSVPGFLVYRLAGVHALDENLAAMQGLYSQVTRGWRPEILSHIGLPADWLPELVACGRPLPAAGGDAAGWRPNVVLSGNDHTAGALGNGCRPGETLVTFGTALVVYRRAGDRPGPFHVDGYWGPYPLGGYYELAVSSHGCDALDWAREQVLPGRPAAEFDSLAERAAPGCGGLLFFPDRARGAGAWSGAGGAEQRARAVLEGILFTLRRLLDRDLAAAPGAPVCAIGGGSRSAVWMRMAADVLGRPVRIGSGDSLLGAAALAAGRADELEGVSRARHEPQSALRAGYDAAYARWLAGGVAG